MEDPEDDEEMQTLLEGPPPLTMDDMDDNDARSTSDGKRPSTGSAKNNGEPIAGPSNASAPGSARNSSPDPNNTNTMPGSAPGPEPTITPSDSARNSAPGPTITPPNSVRNSIPEDPINTPRNSAKNSEKGSAKGSGNEEEAGAPKLAQKLGTLLSAYIVPDANPETCDQANSTEPCASARADSNAKDETQTQPPQSNKYSLSMEVCDSENCPTTTSITLGEPEKEQLKAVGQHLLQIGKELLSEMNFVEDLLEKFGSLVFDKPVTPQAQTPEAAKSKSDQKSEIVDEICRQFENDAPKDVPMTAEQVDALKAQLIDAISLQAKKLNWVHQKTTEYNQMAQAAFYGSAFATPQSSTANNNVEISNQITQAIQADVKKSVAVVEMKVDKLGDRMENCERQIPEVYNTLHELITKIVEEMSVLRDGVGQAREVSENVKVSYEEKLEHLDKQVMKLAQIVWELKCETRAQMHFGREY